MVSPRAGGITGARRNTAPRPWNFTREGSPEPRAAARAQRRPGRGVPAAAPASRRSALSEGAEGVPWVRVRGGIAGTEPLVDPRSVPPPDKPGTTCSEGRGHTGRSGCESTRRSRAPSLPSSRSRLAPPPRRSRGPTPAPPPRRLAPPPREEGSPDGAPLQERRLQQRAPSPPSSAIERDSADRDPGGRAAGIASVGPGAAPPV